MTGQTHGFDADDVAALETTSKIGILGTVTPDGQPHLTMISSLQPRAAGGLMFGQFTEGLSKQNVSTDPRCGFALLTLDRRLYRGAARWTGSIGEGPDYDHINDKPMFRYNTYFGVHTVHRLDLVATGGRERLPLERIVPASLAARLLAPVVRGGEDGPLSGWTRRLINGLSTLKFIAHVGPDGHPAIVPLLPARAADPQRLIFPLVPYAGELARIPDGARVALFAINTALEDVLLRGRFVRRSRFGLPLGEVEVDWVYNAMPPNHRQIWPPQPVRPVTRF